MLAKAGAAYIITDRRRQRSAMYTEPVHQFYSNQNPFMPAAVLKGIMRMLRGLLKAHCRLSKLCIVNIFLKL